MTHTSTEQSAAFHYAELLENDEWINYSTRAEAAVELRRLHAESEQHLQELRSYRITVENREARIAELEAKLIAEAARTAEQKLRAEQFEQRLDMANKLGNDARAELAALKAATAATRPTTQGLDAPNERGWVCQHPSYGRWFISRKSILEDLNTYRKEVGGEAATLDCESVDIWWAEQCGWPEIAAYGKQLSRPDMDALEKEFLNLMKRDTKNVSFHFEQEEIQVTK